jgi:eukaryotic translation initiation factor 2C
MVWNSHLRQNATGREIIWDGNKLAWSSKSFEEVRLMIDLDAEAGKPPRPNGSNTVRLSIKATKVLDPSVIASYLSGTVGAGNEVLEAINFMDHLLREGPAQNSQLIAVKRSFFARDGQRSDLGGGIEVVRGVYQSLRLAQGGRLVLNLDVANTTFWKPSALLSAVLTNQGLRDVNALVAKLQVEGNNGRRSLNAFARQVASRFKGNIVKAKYAGNPAPNKEWKIHKLDINNANEEMLEWRDPQTKQPTGEKVSVNEYFRRKYNIRLQQPRLLLVEMTKKGVKYPMELLFIEPNQRYAAKLDEVQTANMIKFAVAPPSARLAAIQKGREMLRWESDNYLKNYGLQVDPNTIKTAARLLPAPSIMFGGNKPENPGTRGRWDLRGKKFLKGNPQQLKHWAIGFQTGGRQSMDQGQLTRVAQDLIKWYRSYGGDVSNALPFIARLPADAGQAVEQLYQGAGNHYKQPPQLLVILVQDKNSFNYQRLKKSADCRFGCVSQVMQIQQCLKGNPQYYGNVLMKINAKLGGCTTQVKPAPTSGFKGNFAGPTMFIGVDVSHPSPGSQAPSMAAVTVSFDRHAGRYAAACQTNGHRVEMLTDANVRSTLGPLIKKWQQVVGGGQLPAQIYYMRDGVSEGQFDALLRQEIASLKTVLDGISGKPWTGKLTVIVAAKRHHVRAFPKPGDNVAGDQKGNPLPGCLIERDVTMPREFDFFLYSHIALQGTSRPVHYTVIRDDAKHTPNLLQNMIYEHCYQYMRSTTLVSLHPAVYYAHLASNRATAHLNMPAAAGPQGGPGFKQNQPPSSDAPSSEVPPLLPLGGGQHADRIRYEMWYI